MGRNVDARSLSSVVQKVPGIDRQRRETIAIALTGAVGSLMMGVIPGLIWVPRASARSRLKRVLELIKEIAEAIVSVEVIHDLIKQILEVIKSMLGREVQSRSEQDLRELQELRELTDEVLELLYMLINNEALRLEFQAILRWMSTHEEIVQRVSERLQKLEAVSPGPESTQFQALSRYEVILAAFQQKQMKEAASSFAGNVPVSPSGEANDTFAIPTVPMNRPSVESRLPTDPLLCDFGLFAHLCER